MTTASKSSQSGENFADSELSAEQAVAALNAMDLGPFDAAKPADVENAMRALQDIIENDEARTEKLLAIIESRASAQRDSRIGDKSLPSLSELALMGFSPSRSMDKDEPDAFDADWPIGSEEFAKDDHAESAGLANEVKPAWTDLREGGFEELFRKYQTLSREFFQHALEVLPSKAMSFTVKERIKFWDEPIRTYAWMRDNTGIVEVGRGKETWTVLYKIEGTSIYAEVRNLQTTKFRTGLEEPSQFSNELTAAFGGKPGYTRLVLEAIQHAVEGPTIHG